MYQPIAVPTLPLSGSGATVPTNTSPAISGVMIDEVAPAEVFWEALAGNAPEPEVPPPPTPVYYPTPIMFDGDDDSCSICMQAYQGGERVCRLVCRHTFHKNCWDRYMHTVLNAPITDEPRFGASCPNCRGSGAVIAEWNWVGTTVPTQITADGQEVPNDLYRNTQEYAIGTPSDARTPAASPFGSPAGNDDQLPDFIGLSVAMGTGLESSTSAFHIHTRLTDGRPSVIIDPGSVGNLCGDQWAKEVARAAARHGQQPSYERRAQPLKVSGVGNGSQQCAYDCRLPVAFRRADGGEVSVGHITTPAVSDSQLPGLLGLTALRRNRAVLDFSTLKLYFSGPGDTNLPAGLPPGTDCFQCELAPSGHLVLPCCEYQGARANEEHTLTLMSSTRRPPIDPPDVQHLGPPREPGAPPQHDAQ